MSASHLPPDHPAIPPRRIGVLLVNLGTPDATDYWSMRRYLKEFLSDRRVIEVNPVLWWLILNLIILTVRPGRKGRDYDKIWNKERNESFLKTITRSQSEKLAATYADDPRLLVDWAMRYGNPSIASRLDAMQEAGCDRILLVPLYPQYAAATTATTEPPTHPCRAVTYAAGSGRNRTSTGARGKRNTASTASITVPATALTNATARSIHSTLPLWLVALPGRLIT